MVYYYKLSVTTLRNYLDLIESTDFSKIAKDIAQILFHDRNWVRDDVDYPEAVETAELMAFGLSPDWRVDEGRIDGERWVTDECLRRIMDGCNRGDSDIISIITTIINHAPYPDAEFQDY